MKVTAVRVANARPHGGRMPEKGQGAQGDEDDDDGARRHGWVLWIEGNGDEGVLAVAGQ